MPILRFSVRLIDNRYNLGHAVTPMKRPTYITPGEFELMDILWSAGEASVKEVWQKVLPQRQLAYTTVMTVLDKMYRKGIITQRKQGKAYLYTPAIDRDLALKAVLEHILRTYFNNSPSELLRFISRDESLSSAESGADALQPTLRNDLRKVQQS
jgi:predicted transcriptional regulator